MLNLNLPAIGELVNNQTIMITGGTGSFGHQVTRTILTHFHPKKLIIFSRDEFKQAMMNQTLSQELSPEKHNLLRFFLGDVRDQPRLEQALNGVDIVFHAAALKRIDTLEYNPQEAIKTNVLGTQNLINASIKEKVKRVIFISTDKATAPVNLYGSTKLCAEKLVIAANSLAGEDGTIFGVLRYGNVFASRGSVVPIFAKQKENNVLTITDTQMTRFTLTLEEAISFVLNCASVMIGGEVFIPKIPSYDILQLALVIAPDAEQKIIGLRPGEKLHESMICSHEGHLTLDCQSFYVIRPSTKFHQNLNYIEHYRELGFDPQEMPSGFSYSSDENQTVNNQVLTALVNQYLETMDKH